MESGTLTEWLEEAKPTEWVRRNGLLDVVEEHKILQQGAVTQTKTVTWNVAAINNNPFEYWMSYPDEPRYAQMMIAVENFVLSPGLKDVVVTEVFTDEMFAGLMSKMQAAGWANLDQVEAIWKDDYKQRTVMKTFLQDKLLGKKRLMSMGDRVTNTLTTQDQGTLYRPTVVNAYTEDMNSHAVWWPKWLTFMFDNTVTVSTKTGPKTDKICTLLIPIKKAKYEAITPEEELISIPLQTLCLAIFDAVLLYIVNTVSPGSWPSIKMSICQGLVLQKPQKLCKILADYYKEMDVMCLQECSTAVITVLQQQLGTAYHIIVPGDADGTRDQNSLLCLSKKRYAAGYTEITQNIIETFPEESRTSVMAGDLLVITCKTVTGQDYVLASFHGDSNGLATPVVTQKTAAFIEANHPTAKFVFGMDANTCSKDDPEKLTVPPFLELCGQLRLGTCWGDSVVTGREAYTSYIGRSFLQPQLQKGIKFNDLATKGDRDLKDYILFKKDQYRVSKMWKDCSGSGAWIEDAILPSFDFPSDHAMLVCTLTELS